jgi:hypothetical protein
VGSFWITSTLALAMVSVLFLLRLQRAMGQPLKTGR